LHIRELKAAKRVFHAIGKTVNQPTAQVFAYRPIPHCLSHVAYHGKEDVWEISVVHVNVLGIRFKVNDEELFTVLKGAFQEVFEPEEFGGLAPSPVPGKQDMLGLFRTLKVVGYVPDNIASSPRLVTTHVAWVTAWKGLCRVALAVEPCNVIWHLSA
jgi:hypothetical protein